MSLNCVDTNKSQSMTGHDADYIEKMMIVSTGINCSVSYD